MRPTVPQRSTLPLRATEEIHVVGLEFRGPHGVHAHERAEGRRFRADVVVHVDPIAGCATDRLEDTLDYRTIAAIVVEEGTGASSRLVEHLAQRMVERLLALPQVCAVDLRLLKDAPSVVGSPEWVGVRLVRVRAEGEL